jgi:hypothetical protein
MDIVVLFVFGIVALAAGIWIGVGAPGMKFKPRYTRHHSGKRGLNPIAWGRTHHTTRRRR